VEADLSSHWVHDNPRQDRSRRRAAELQIKVLEEPTLPEPPRHGEAGPEDCHACNSPDADFLWTDEHWRLGSLAEPAALPAMVQMRGTCLPLWDDVLPKLPNAVWTETNRRIAQAMDTGFGGGGGYQRTKPVGKGSVGSSR
jgi:hypothetical protein